MFIVFLCLVLILSIWLTIKPNNFRKFYSRNSKKKWSNLRLCERGRIKSVLFVCPFVCLSVHPWRIFLRIFSVNFSSLYEAILPYTKKWQRRILENCICCLHNWVNETNLDLKQNIWHFNEGNMVFFCFKWCSIIDHMILWNCIPGKNMVLKL